jgi:hypothetical protein
MMSHCSARAGSKQDEQTNEVLVLVLPLRLIVLLDVACRRGGPFASGS